VTVVKEVVVVGVEVVYTEIDSDVSIDVETYPVRIVVLTDTVT
jgi:hypothetical protein